MNDYYVITSGRGQNPDRWSWEIRRKRKPLGIKMIGDGFLSDTSAGGFNVRFGKRRRTPKQVKPPQFGTALC
jgi:hypothetical protein